MTGSHCDQNGQKRNAKISCNKMTNNTKSGKFPVGDAVASSNNTNKKDGSKIPSKRGSSSSGGGNNKSKYTKRVSSSSSNNSNTHRRHNSNSNNKNNKGSSLSKKSSPSKFRPKSVQQPASLIQRGSKREVIFDPEARKAHLRGFSERKRQRRAYGLAMQQVKDRNAKIEQRAKEKKDELARVEEAERQKEELFFDAAVTTTTHPLHYHGRENDDESSNNNDTDEDDDDNGDHDDDDANEEDGKEEDDNTNNKKHNIGLLDGAATGTKNFNGVNGTKVYDDGKTEMTWGGQVTVTTTVVDLGDDDNDDDVEIPLKKTRGGNGSTTTGRTNALSTSTKSVDVAQKYAGNVQKYLDKFKGQMPSKKKKDNGAKAKRKGKNGAADMLGMGGAANLKVAQKLLRKSKDGGGKRSSMDGAGSGGPKKGKRGKRR